MQVPDEWGIGVSRASVYIVGAKARPVNGTTKTSAYEQRYRPTENKLSFGAATVADFLYSEDGVGKGSLGSVVRPCIMAVDGSTDTAGG